MLQFHKTDFLEILKLYIEFLEGGWIWFGLFNIISTFVGYVMAKPSGVEQLNEGFIPFIKLFIQNSS